MTLTDYRRHALLAAGVLTAVLAGAVPAAADCASDLTASQQSLEQTRAGVAATTSGTDAQKCAAQRRYVVAQRGERNRHANNSIALPLQRNNHVSPARTVGPRTMHQNDGGVLQ